jgi:hypothetical protein
VFGPTMWRLASDPCGHLLFADPSEEHIYEMAGYVPADAHKAFNKPEPRRQALPGFTLCGYGLFRSRCRIIRECRYPALGVVSLET